MKIKLTAIMDAINLGTSEGMSYLNIKTGEVRFVQDGEMRDVEENTDLSDSPEWYRSVVAYAKEVVDHSDDYLECPSKYKFNEYEKILDFCNSISIEAQREDMLSLIKGSGAFSRFKRGIERCGLLDEWYKYKDTEIKAFAKQWCEENNFEYE